MKELFLMAIMLTGVLVIEFWQRRGEKSLCVVEYTVNSYNPQNSYELLQISYFDPNKSNFPISVKIKEDKSKHLQWSYSFKTEKNTSLNLSLAFSFQETKEMQSIQILVNGSRVKRKVLKYKEWGIATIRYEV